MVNKLFQNKQEFMDGIEIKYEDFRENPAKRRENWSKLSSKSKKKYYRVRPQHFLEAMWMLRKYGRYDTIKIGFLDGEMLLHITGEVNIQNQEGEFKGTVYLSNGLDQSICYGNSEGKTTTKHFGPRSEITVKQFFKTIREMRDFIEQNIW